MNKVIASSDLSARRANRQTYDRPWLQKPKATTTTTTTPKPPAKPALKPLRFASPALLPAPKSTKVVPARAEEVAKPLKSAIRTQGEPSRPPKAVHWDLPGAPSSPSAPRAASPPASSAAAAAFPGPSSVAAAAAASLPAAIAGASVLPPLPETLEEWEVEARDIMSRIREMGAIPRRSSSSSSSGSSSGSPASPASTPSSSPPPDHSGSWKPRNLPPLRLSPSSSAAPFDDLAFSPIRKSAMELLARFRED